MFVPLHWLVCTNLSRCLHFAFSSNKTLQSRSHRLHIILNRQLNELHVIIIAKYTKQASKREERRGGGEEERRREKESPHSCCNCAATLVPHPLAGRFWRLYPWGPWIKVKSASQELPSKQSLCVTTQSTLYSGSSLVMALTRRHTGGQEGKSSDRHDRSKVSDRLGAITLGTQALRVVALAHHRKENKATYVAQEATKEGDSRTPRDPGMNAAPQST